MMLKNITRFEVKIEGRIYQFCCDPDSPTQHCKEALFQCLKYVGQIEDSSKKIQDESKANQPEQEPECQ